MNKFYHKHSFKVNQVSTYKNWTNLTYANSDIIRAFDIDWKIGVRFSGYQDRFVGLFLYANQSPRKEYFYIYMNLLITV